MKVVCVKQGTRYGAHWVTRLKSMVRANLAAAHEFICLTDAPVDGVECLPLSGQLVGWWAKIELFRPGQFEGSVLYFDLDVVISSPIDEVARLVVSDPAKLWMRDDFSYSMRKPRQDIGIETARLLGGIGCCNSSVMGWHGDAARAVWDRFSPAVMDELHGDQNHISRVMRDRIAFFPDELVGSYKYAKVRNEPRAPVTVFHGNPKMDELPRNDELRRLWEAA